MKATYSEYDVVRGAYEWGKAVIADYKKNGEKVPEWVYERALDLAEKLIQMKEAE